MIFNYCTAEYGELIIDALLPVGNHKFMWFFDI